jgi:hypothetical protein
MPPRIYGQSAALAGGPVFSERADRATTVSSALFMNECILDADLQRRAQTVFKSAMPIARQPRYQRPSQWRSPRPFSRTACVNLLSAIIIV